MAGGILLAVFIIALIAFGIYGVQHSEHGGRGFAWCLIIVGLAAAIITIIK